LQIAGLNIPNKFEVWHKKGAQLSCNLHQSLALSKDGSIYLLGNNILFAISPYASFQMVEFFGNIVFAHKLEEFCHSPIFGLNRSDHVWILGQKETRVKQKLSALDQQFTYVELYNEDPMGQLFESIFFVQNLMLLLAQKRETTELQYVLMKHVLKASSDIIYDKMN